MIASGARAHTGGAPISPHDVWTAWTLQPSVVVPIAVAALLYGRGLHLAWRRAGFGGGTAAWRAGLFALALLALWAGLVWPLDAIGESLFSAHMAQHIALMGVAAPLLVLALPIPTMIRALPREWQRGLALAVRWEPWRSFREFVTRIGVASVLQLAVFTFWHSPALVAVALEDEIVHSMMHGSILGVGLLYWISIARMRPGQAGWDVLSLFVTFKYMLLTGALIGFAPHPFYDSYADRVASWGFTLLADQQIAGVLMMVAGSMMYLMALLVRSALLLRAPGGRVAAGLPPQAEGIAR